MEQGILVMMLIYIQEMVVVQVEGVFMVHQVVLHQQGGLEQ